MGRKPIGSHIIKINEVDSTNRYMVDLLAEKTPEEGTIVVALKQYAGKGQGDHKWESEPGKNLTLSFVVYPDFLDISRQFMLNKIISLAIRDFIVEELESKEVRIKWMNDVYVGDKKIAGMLINNAILGNGFKHVVVGIGINVNQDVFRSDAPNPTSLKLLTGKSYNLDTCLTKLFYFLNNRYLQLKEGQGATIDHDYLLSLYRSNKLHPFIYKDNKIMAKIEGVDEYGRLIMTDSNGKVLVCEQGEVVIVIGSES